MPASRHDAHRNGRQRPSSGRAGAAVVVGVASLVVAGIASTPAAADRRFGPHDVPTIFYISKSDDRNRVDYGVRLDANCRPTSAAPLFAYWRRFEPGQARFGDLNFMDRRAYAIERQSVRTTSDTGSWIEMRLRPLPRVRILVLVQAARRGCRARAQTAIRGEPAFLDHIHVQLAGPMRVDHILIRGEDVRTGTPVFERRRR